MTTILILLLMAGGYALFTLARPHKGCTKCSGWGQRTKRRRPVACPRCKGTGKQFRLVGRLVHHGTAQAMKYMRERKESES